MSLVLPAENKAHFFAPSPTPVAIRDPACIIAQRIENLLLAVGVPIRSRLSIRPALLGEQRPTRYNRRVASKRLLHCRPFSRSRSDSLAQTHRLLDSHGPLGRSLSRRRLFRHRAAGGFF